MSPFNVNYS